MRAILANLEHFVTFMAEQYRDSNFIELAEPCSTRESRDNRAEADASSEADCTSSAGP